MISIAFVEHPESASNKHQTIGHTFAEILPSLLGISGSNPIVNFRRIVRMNSPLEEAGFELGSRVTRTKVLRSPYVATTDFSAKRTLPGPT